MSVKNSQVNLVRTTGTSAPLSLPFNEIYSVSVNTMDMVMTVILSLVGRLLAEIDSTTLADSSYISPFSP